MDRTKEDGTGATERHDRLINFFFCAQAREMGFDHGEHQESNSRRIQAVRKNMGLGKGAYHIIMRIRYQFLDYFNRFCSHSHSSHRLRFDLSSLLPSQRPRLIQLFANGRQRG